MSTADGDYRMVYAINGQIPGPEIIVTEGDMVSATKFQTYRKSHLNYVFDIDARIMYFVIPTTRQQPHLISCTYEIYSQGGRQGGRE